MNTSKEDRQLAYDFFFAPAATALHKVWIETGANAANVHEDAVALSELLASVRVRGGLNELREAHAVLETKLLQAAARAENLERERDELTGLRARRDDVTVLTPYTAPVFTSAEASCLLKQAIRKRDERSADGKPVDVLDSAIVKLASFTELIDIVKGP